MSRDSSVVLTLPPLKPFLKQERQAVWKHERNLGLWEASS